jgi:effector-binding domain-containing protein
MRKKILLGILGILGIVVLLAIVGFFLPGNIEVSRSISVHAPAEYSFEEVDNLENWKKWSYWHSLDPEMKLNFSDKRFGAGAFYSWDGPETGKGKMTITESTPSSSIKADLDFMEQGTAKSWYTFEPEGENTKVTMGFSTDFGMNPIMRWMGATMFRSEMNKAFDYNLAKIKELAEAKPTYSVKITEEAITPVHYVGLAHTMSPKDHEAVGKQMGKMYGELVGALKKSKVEIAGAPFCLYPKYSEESMDMVCALPVAANVKLPAKYPVKELAGGKAIKAVHMGTYENLTTTYTDLDKYIAFKKLTVTGAPWEVYITDPMTEPDTSKWITEVYFPVSN